MIIQPLHAAPQHASRVTEWLWQAFGGETLPQAFFASIVGHSQTPGALPITFIAAEGEMLLGTVGLWRCDLISRQDLYPWMAALYVAPEARGRGWRGNYSSTLSAMPERRAIASCFSTPPVAIFMNVSAGSISAKAWIIRPSPSVYTATIYRYREAQSPSDGGPAWG